MPCALPCDVLPCSLRCEEYLSCGHQCPSVCGESCPCTEFCQQCASTTIKQTPVDFGSLIAIGTLRYQDIELDETPILVPACGHIILMATLDRHMGFSDHYKASKNGQSVAFHPECPPLSVHEVKRCPHCQGSLRNLNRYNRLIKRSTIDESTKKFILQSNMDLHPFTIRLQQEEKRRINTKSTIDASTTAIKSKLVFVLPKLVRLGGPRGVLFHKISELPGLGSRCGPLLALHDEILMLSGRIIGDEQPFAQLQQMVGQRPQAMYRARTLQTTSGLLSKALLLRCEYDILSEIINLHQEQAPKMGKQYHWLTIPLCLDLDFQRQYCGELINEAVQKIQPITELEARLLFAKFVGLEKIASINPDGIEELLPQARRQAKIAKSISQNLLVLGRQDLHDLELEKQVMERELDQYLVREDEYNVRCKVLDCTKLFAGMVFWRKHVEKRHPEWYEKMKASVISSTSSMLAEIEKVERMLIDGKASTIVTSTERQAIYLEMAQNLEGAGLWCYCANMHAVRILAQVPTPELTTFQFKAENNEASHKSRCPQCSELAAGPFKDTVEGVPDAVDLEHHSRDMMLSAQFDLLEMGN